MQELLKWYSKNKSIIGRELYLFILGLAISEDMLNNPGDTTLHPTSVDIRVTPASPNGGIITALRICVPLGSLKKENNI